MDDCLGIVRLKDLLATCLVGEAANLPQLLQTPLYVPESSRALKVLETFQASGTHIALITDEYGGIEGIVTLNDLVEAIIGEMPTIEEINEPQILQAGRWLLAAGWLAYPPDTLKELLQQDSLPHEANAQYHTLGGFVVAMFERIPQSGEHFDALGFRFEVVDMDGTRVDKILVTPLGSRTKPLPTVLSTLIRPISMTSEARNRV